MSLTIPPPPPSQLNFNIVNLKDAAQIYPQPEYVFVLSVVDARVALKNFPASKVISLNKGDTDPIYKIFMTHLPELQDVYESLIDEQSKKTFCGYWLARISNQLGKIVYSNAAHYLINGFIPAQGAIVIDCGVFDGGTAAVFAEMGYKVYGFEVDKKNFAVAQQVAKEKNFVVENFALGSYNHEEYFSSTGLYNNYLTGKGSDIAKVITLDSYVGEKNLPHIDFIKLDVEGAELDVLKGAVTTIARYKPILALSAYHKWEDFWTLMNFVKSIRSDYEFALRQSYDSPEDVPTNFDSERIENLISLGLEPDGRNFHECVLFAR